jgi:small membrane protein
MTSIQVILITLSLLAAIVGSFAFQSRLGYRLLAVVFFIAASGFVLFPNSTTKIAHALGVGRGADLLLYVALFAGIHAFLLLYLKTRRLERKITELIRTMAIRDAQDLDYGGPVAGGTRDVERTSTEGPNPDT